MASKKTTLESKIRVETIKHDEAKRKNIPTAEYQSIMQKGEQRPKQISYERRNRDLDPQLFWRGKDEQDWSDLVVYAPPLYIQDKVHPKVLIDDLIRRAQSGNDDGEQLDLFADFNGLPNDGAKTEFYQHDAHWSNRMILGDSLQVMASLAEREGLREKVQCIYFDPPYGIQFKSNFQWSTTTQNVKDGNREHITREPEQVKAFRDTWRDGIHSYLNYLRDRLTIARDLLTDSGSIFVQIGDVNVHRLRCLLDEVFGEDNFISQIAASKTSGLAASGALASGHDYVLHYAKSKERLKFRELFVPKEEETTSASEYFNVQLPDGTRRRMTDTEKEDPSSLPQGSRAFRTGDLTKPGPGSKYNFKFREKEYSPRARWWGTPAEGLARVAKANRIHEGGSTINYVRFLDDFPVKPITNYWRDVSLSSRFEQKVYVVQTSVKLVQRCVLMATDPGDLVLDPTCGSGTTAVVAEQWGRRWITIDTSRVALALARCRVMGARYPYFLLSDSREGQIKEAELSRTSVSSKPVYGKVRAGFVYERAPHITTKTIANNAEIDVIWDRWTQSINSLLRELNKLTKQSFREWELPNTPNETWPLAASEVLVKLKEALKQRQCEIDASIMAHAEFQYIYDKPIVDRSRVRVSGPFTVESISPHHAIAVDANDDLVDVTNDEKRAELEVSFTNSILDNLRRAGVQQAHKEDKIDFGSIIPWPGRMVCAEGVFKEEKSGKDRKAAIFIGPEFGTVSRPDLVEAAKEAGDADFDVLIACAFNFDARASDFQTLGRIPVLKARMNADLHMAGELKNTGKGNLFVIFGEPDIEIRKLKDSKIQVKINGVDVFNPTTGEVKSDGADGIACWFVDTDYNEESFFVRHAYFLGANDPYKSLKTSLKAEIDQDVWLSLNSDTSKPFPKPKSGRIAVKVINHLGDEVMKVFKTELDAI